MKDDPATFDGVRDMDTELLDFTQKALATGCKREEIATATRRLGWGGH